MSVVRIVCYFVNKLLLQENKRGSCALTARTRALQGWEPLLQGWGDGQAGLEGSRGLGTGTAAGRGECWGDGFPVGCGGFPRDKVGEAGASVGPLATVPAWWRASSMALDPGTLFPGHAGLGRTPETLGMAMGPPQPGYSLFLGGLLNFAAPPKGLDTHS